MEKLYNLKEFILSKKYLIFILIILLVVSVGVVCLLLFTKPNKKVKEVVVEKVESNLEKPEEIVDEKEEVTQEKEELVLVDIKGEVNRPGLYQVSKNSRVQDIINLAGGTTNNADTTTINLSKKVFDEMVIIVYQKKLDKDLITSENKKEESPKQEIINDIKECPTKTEIVNDACVKEEDISGNNQDNSKTEEILDEIKEISINASSKEELMNIPGIGESKADKIIEYRNNIGLFKELEDIKNVSGIGEALFEKIKPYIKL